MVDRSRTPITVTTTRIGRTDLGQGSVVVDDDVLTLIVPSSADERPIRIPLSSVDGIALDGDELHISLRDGPVLTLVSESAPTVRDELLACCRALPELTRTLRAFGSRRGHRSTRGSAPHDQQRFFAPLLDARRQAAAAHAPGAAIAAFDAESLARAFERALRMFAVERHTENGPSRRALEAELSDLAEPLLLSIRALGIAADSAGGSLDDLRLWRVWAGQLRTTFEVADRVWLSLDVALESVVGHAPPRRT